MRILEHPKFDLKEFSERWQKARLSALGAVVTQNPAESSQHSEGEMLQSIPAEAKEIALRKVFDHSRKFGLSAARHLGMSFEISDLAEVLPHLGLPCFRGQWRSHNSAQVLERNGCGSLEALGSFGCDYWREALDGLVMGVGENERLSRHRSRGHGDSECIDVLFTEENTVPRVVGEGSLVSSQPTPKQGPVPPEIAEALKPTEERFRAMKVGFVLCGLSEGKLYYKLDPEVGVLCGAGGKLMHDSFVRELAQLYPALEACDAAPLAVYGGST